ncbi:MAG TPA: beta-ketoacyl-[acyl-carrier-protein] synthase family protein [Vicinamibacterales bacterium]|nr:beta-ketoacyl-[acyl-carrier-protein] synthase family protein [Vicinamibacterales bacterium]
MSSPQTAVAITGIGVVSPFGVGRDRFWRAIVAGESGIVSLSGPETDHLTSRVTAQVPDVSIREAEAAANGAWTNAEARSDLRRSAKVSRIAVLAAREAMLDAGLDPTDSDIGVIVGSGAGGIDVAERQYGDYYSGDFHKVSPYAIPVSIVGIVSSEISIALGLRGPSHVLSTGCTSSTDAVGYAAGMVRHGEADVVLTGGADACATPGMLFGFGRMRAASTHFNDRPQEASRPFDRDRDGFVLGEGAWILTLERLERARARGARVYATVDGYGSTCDAYHRVQMDPDGAEIVRCIQIALSRAGREARDIGYVSFHGTSTVLNDAVESKCVRQVFGSSADRMAGSSIKSMIGHPQGASGAAGIVASAMALAEGWVPPTINLQTPDPECTLDYVPNVARKTSADFALCNCLGFGSKNSAVVLGRA